MAKTIALALAFWWVATSGTTADARTGKPARSREKDSAERLLIGGSPAVRLTRPRSGERPQFLGVDVLPGRGMNVYQVRAYLPGRGEISLLASPPLSEAARRMNGGPDDVNGNESFKAGGAILLPYANRVRGTLLPDGKSLAVPWDDRTITLPANWKGRKEGAERHAMHGLILDARFQEVQVTRQGDGSAITGLLHAGDLGGRWPSETDVAVTVTLTGEAVRLEVVAWNVGDEPEPMGIGWHPYFAIPSGERQQVRLRIPGTDRVLVDNYDDVFPVGLTERVPGTAYDFTEPAGRPLGTLFLDDNWTGLQREGGVAVAKVIDPAAGYGLRVIGVSPRIRAIQVFAPMDEAFVALEPQFNLADPFNRQIWADRDTGMVVLQPGESATYEVRLEIFQPLF